jgi:hypothetical protein
VIAVQEPETSAGAVLPLPKSDPAALRVLSGVYSVLGRLPAVRWHLPGGLMRRAARVWLRRAVLRSQLAREDDVTILIGVRDRADYRLVNALASLRAQTYPRPLVHAVVVDYGSQAPVARHIAAACRRYEADYVRADRVTAWNRSRCLNIAVRRATTKYLLTSDADLVFSSTYLADAVRMLRRSPLSVVCSPMQDLPAECADYLERSAREECTLCVEDLAGDASPRYEWELHPSIGITYTAYHQLIHGYDEFYELYGSEDEDLAKRFQYLGLDLVALDSAAFYLHQWHPKFEGVTTHPNLERVITRNRDHLTRTHTILRNTDGWGTAAGGT